MQLNLTVFLVLLGSSRVKAAHKTLVKLTPGVDCITVFTSSFYPCEEDCHVKQFFSTFGIWASKNVNTLMKSTLGILILFFFLLIKIVVFGEV